MVIDGGDGDGGDGDDDKENGVFEMFRTGWNKCFCLLAKKTSLPPT